MCDIYSAHPIYNCDPRAAQYKLAGHGVGTYSPDTANTDCLGHTVSLSSSVPRIHHVAVFLQLLNLLSRLFYRGADKSLARPTSRCILFDGENILFDASLVSYIYIYINIYY